MANALKDIDIKNQDTLALLNDELSDVTNDAFATPYMALERVRKVLGYFHIHLPAYRFLDAEEGNTVFHVDQFGEKAGFDEHGNPMNKEDSGLFLYFEWGLDESGIYTIFSEIVNEEELNDLLDAYEGDEGDEMLHEGLLSKIFKKKQDPEAPKFAKYRQEKIDAFKEGFHHGYLGKKQKEMERHEGGEDEGRPIKEIDHHYTEGHFNGSQARKQLKQTGDYSVKHAEHWADATARDEYGHGGVDMKEDTNIDVDVPKTIMKIRTKFAKQIEANNEKDRENEMASGRPVNESKHGSPNDKGHSDAWYGRGNKNPHPKGSQEHGEYEAGYKEGQENGGKDWGSGRMGGRVNEGMRDMNSRYFKKAVADRKNVKAAAEAKEKEVGKPAKGVDDHKLRATRNESVTPIVISAKNKAAALHKRRMERIWNRYQSADNNREIKKPVKEEALHELTGASRDKLKKYIKKSDKSMIKAMDTNDLETQRKRKLGSRMALRKLYKNWNDDFLEEQKEENLQENLSLAGAKAKAKRESTTGVSHVNKLPNGKYQTTPWFSKNTVISYERRKPYYDKTVKEENLQENLSLSAAKAKAKADSHIKVAHVTLKPNGKYFVSPVRLATTVVSYDQGESFNKKAIKEENLQELSRELLGRYVNKVRNSVNYPDDDGGKHKAAKRREGLKLAGKKRWGDKNYGLPEPKIKGTD